MGSQRLTTSISAYILITRQYGIITMGTLTRQLCSLCIPDRSSDNMHEGLQYL